MALQAACELGRNSALDMPADFHLRLLHALANDVVNCLQMKTELNTR
jgi:hypothetical protein